MKQLSACAEQESLDFSVQSDVRAAKVVDGLLRIANNEQLSWHWIGGPPICDRVIVSGKQQKDFCLERIGVLA